MSRCDRCGIRFEPVHSRHRFCSSECRRGKPKTAPMLANRAALETQVEAMATGPEHRALIQSCRTLADHVDSLDYFDDKAWREYRLALDALMEAVDDGGPDPYDNFIEGLRSKVRDTEDAKP